MTDYEKFVDEFNDLSVRDKVALYRDYQREVGDSEEWFDFDEEFFNLFFDDPMEAVRAWHFGSDDNSWDDEYIRIDAYGNLETANEDVVEEEANNAMQDIFDYPDVWEEYFTLPDDEDDEEEDSDEG